MVCMHLAPELNHAGGSVAQDNRQLPGKPDAPTGTGSVAFYLVLFFSKFCNCPKTSVAS